jgi:hypothetical protein
MSLSAGLLVVVLATCVIGVLGIVVVGRARRGARAKGDDGLATRAGTQRLLAENWALVEKAARESGMNDDEIRRVRANLLGLGDG